MKQSNLLDSGFGERNYPHTKPGLNIKTDHVSGRPVSAAYLEDLHELYHAVANLLQLEPEAGVA